MHKKKVIRAIIKRHCYMLDVSATALSFQHKKTTTTTRKKNTYTMYNDMQDGKRNPKEKRNTNQPNTELSY